MCKIVKIKYVSPSGRRRTTERQQLCFRSNGVNTCAYVEVSEVTELIDEDGFFSLVGDDISAPASSPVIDVPTADSYRRLEHIDRRYRAKSPRPRPQLRGHEDLLHEEIRDLDELIAREEEMRRREQMLKQGDLEGKRYSPLAAQATSSGSKHDPRLGAQDTRSFEYDGLHSPHEGEDHSRATGQELLRQEQKKGAASRFRGIIPTSATSLRRKKTGRTREEVYQDLAARYPEAIEVEPMNDPYVKMAKPLKEELGRSNQQREADNADQLLQVEKENDRQESAWGKQKEKQQAREPNEKPEQELKHEDLPDAETRELEEDSVRQFRLHSAQQAVEQSRYQPEHLSSHTTQHTLPEDSDHHSLSSISDSDVSEYSQRPWDYATYETMLPWDHVMNTPLVSGELSDGSNLDERGEVVRSYDSEEARSHNASDLGQRETIDDRELSSRGDIVDGDEEDRALHQSKLKRGSTEGYHKRDYAQSIGNRTSDGEDVQLFGNVSSKGKTLHRLRRKYGGIRPSIFDEIADDDSDVSDHPHSIFSLENASLYSQSSIGSLGDFVDAFEQLVLLLAGHDKLQSLCEMAIQSADVGPERFERNFRRLLQIFGSQLRQEASPAMVDQCRAADLVRRRARDIASRIRNRYVDKSDRTRTMETPKDEESGDSSADDGDDHEPPQTETADFSNVKVFMITSKAFESLMQGVGNLVDPPWSVRLLTVLDDFHNRPQRYEVTDTDLQDLDRLIADLRFVDVRTVQFSETYRQSRLDRLQCYFEVWTGTSWNWWPFRQPQDKLKPRHGYISWTCSCGETRWQQIPRSTLPKLARLISKELASLRTKPVLTMLQNSCITGAVGSAQAQSGPSKNAADDNSAKHSLNQAAGKMSTVSSHTGGTATSGRHFTSANYGKTVSSLLHVFLTVTSGDLCLAQIRCEALSDDGFFEALKRGYITKRGWLRYIFSPWAYEGCEFAMLVKSEHRTHVFHKKGLPTSDICDFHDYKFRPNPPKPNPPITEHEFKHHFYKCYRTDRGAHNARLCRFYGCQGKDRPKTVLLEMIPKRERPVEEDGGSRQEYWGLYAKEKPRAYMAFLYTLGALAGPVIFWGLWMKAHLDDISGAIAPITVALASISLVITFWGIMIVSKQAE